MDNTNSFKYWYRKEICDKQDWRIKHVYNTETKNEKVPWNNNTYEHDVWSVLLFTQPFIFNKNVCHLVIPEMTALYLNISHKHFIEARKFLHWLKKWKDWFISLSDNWFDYLENITVSITFAISALEVYFNQFLLTFDKDTIFWTKTNKKWNIKQLWIKEMEFLTLEEKYYEAMTYFFEIDSSRIVKI